MKRMVRVASLAMCVALVIAGCSSSPAPTTNGSETTTATTAAPNPALRPIDQAAFQAVVEKAAKDLYVPGAMVVLRTPQGEYRAAVGTTELGKPTPPAADTHFRIASNTKTFTAALIVLLAQDGKLKFSDPVSNYVPDVPNGANITIAELLKMRSGLYNYTAAPELSDSLDTDPAKAWTPQEVLAIAFRHPPNFAPGAEYEYSNTNYALLGLVAEKAGGQPAGPTVPGPIVRSGRPRADVASRRRRHRRSRRPTHTATCTANRLRAADDPYPAEMQAEIRAGTLKPIDYTNQNSSYATAAGGAISTADDLATWIKALVSGKVFNADYPAAVVGQPAGRGSRMRPTGRSTGTASRISASARTRAMYYHGGELPGSTRSSVTTRTTM